MLKSILVVVIWASLEAASVWIVAAAFLAFEPYDRIFTNYTPYGLISSIGHILKPVGCDCNETLARTLLIVSVLFGIISIIGLTVTFCFMIKKGLDDDFLKKCMMAASFSLVLASIFANMSATCIIGKDLDVDKSRIYNLNMADEFGLGVGFIGSGIFSVL